MSDATERSTSQQAPTPPMVVGVGASAGGLESLEQLFRGIPADSGMAFVVIQHLSPDFKSMMDELLARDTTMPIVRAADGMEVQANHVYLLPPRKEMTIESGRLRLMDKDVAKGLALPIDRFFSSLAADCGPRGVAVVLSGSGSDGSRGVCEVAQSGGLVIAETLSTARFDGMPMSAQATGVVHAVLPPAEIGGLLVRHARNPLLLKQGLLVTAPMEPPPPIGMEAIFEIFRQRYDLDFSLYRPSTIARRVARRLALADSSELDEYAARLRNDPAELNQLYEDLLIGVTQFFRDPESFTKLRQEVLPDMLRDSDPDRPLRVWVAGCATGEEAYSLAILIDEVYQQMGRPMAVKIFATDVHRHSLEYAARGLYPAESVIHVPAAVKQKYFTQHDNGYQVSADIRKSLVFAHHNVLKDAPFTELDLVTCRNMLIYLQPHAQLKVLSLFHFGLRPGGVLFLGSSESPSELSGELATIDQHHKLYRKLRNVRLTSDLRLPIPRRAAVSSPRPSLRTGLEDRSGAESSMLHTYDLLLDRYMPPSLLLNSDRQLLDCFNGAESLLEVQGRRPSLDALSLLDPEIRTTLVGALQRVAKDRQTVRFSGVRVRARGKDQLYNVTVEALSQPESNTLNYLIAFHLVGQTPLENFEPAPLQGRLSSANVQRLEDELRYAKENLQATVEELETSNEELQATNEELIASNEELQSTNEELHSVNEELYTVNAEHQRKISELAELNQDLHHLLENTNVATIFLDRELRVRKFTTRVHDVFDLLETDVGRPLASFSHRLRHSDLIADAQSVLTSEVSIEREVHADDDTCYLLRLQPYRVLDGVLGVVVSLVDISALDELRGRLRWLSAIVESSDDAIISVDLSGRVNSWNRGAEVLYGYRAEEMVGETLERLTPPERQTELRQLLARVAMSEHVKTLETVRQRRDGTLIDVSVTISPVHNPEGRVVGASKIDRDITSEKAARQAVHEQVHQREQFLAMLSHELRNPLSAVLHATRLLRGNHASAADQAAGVETIERQASLMASLLNDLLDVARVSHGKISLRKERLDLRSLMEDVRQSTAAAVNAGESILNVHVPDDPLWVDGDPGRLIQIQANLITNAAKYSPNGTAIDVRLGRDAGHAEISVRDYGAGIPPEFLPRIFEPFEQSNATLHRSEGGLGVGLSLVKSLTEMHGGTVSVHSPGADFGSEFLIRLPLAEPPTPQAPCDSGSTVSPLRSLRIVLVEDQADNRRLLAELLRLDGHNVDTAADGHDGIRCIEHVQPDVALVDIGLPGLDGYELARRVRQAPALRRVQLVALTGYGRPTDIEQAHHAGFDHHLVKPVDAQVLNQLLNELASEIGPRIQPDD
jgi:two-component system, chemotaxis family, CheB/CheR fusion protein